MVVGHRKAVEHFLRAGLNPTYTAPAADVRVLILRSAARHARTVIGVPFPLREALRESLGRFRLSAFVSKVVDICRQLG